MDQKEHTCPVWAGYFLLCPLRKAVHNPKRLLSPFVRRGMKVLDVGPGMGFFTLPMAEMVGPGGRVVAVDLQSKMLEVLKKRAEKRGLSERIETVQCTEDSLMLDGREAEFDLALLFAVVHEVKEPEELFRQLSRLLKRGGMVILAEPRGHVSEEDFSSFVEMAEKEGLKRERTLKVPLSRAVLLRLT